MSISVTSIPSVIEKAIPLTFSETLTKTIKVSGVIGGYMILLNIAEISVVYEEHILISLTEKKLVKTPCSVYLPLRFQVFRVTTLFFVGQVGFQSWGRIIPWNLLTQDCCVSGGR